jgi:flagellar hook protein FlgE
VLGGHQIGRGAKLNGVTQIFSQGSVTQTDKATDVALTGDGFFVVDTPEGRSYTRNGSFNFNKDGELVNVDGNLVKGFKADDDGKITTKLENIKLDRTIIDAKKTEKVDISMNLDTRADIPEAGFDPANPDKTSSYSTGITVFDSAGNSHNLTMYFQKQADNTWKWTAMGKGEEMVGGEKGKGMIGASGTLTFTIDGKLQSQTIEQNASTSPRAPSPSSRSTSTSVMISSAAAPASKVPPSTAPTAISTSTPKTVTLPARSAACRSTTTARSPLSTPTA